MATHQTLLQTALHRAALESDARPTPVRTKSKLSAPSSPSLLPNGTPARKNNLPDFSVLYLDQDTARDDQRKRFAPGSSDSDLEDDEDGDLVPVSSPHLSRAGSRHASPPGTPVTLEERRRRRREERERESERTKGDPIRRFPDGIKLVIFGHLTVQDLKRCRRVCRRWKDSATLNYCWFKLFQSTVFHDAPATQPSSAASSIPSSPLLLPQAAASAFLPIPLTLTPSKHGTSTPAGPAWTRKESKQDWFGRYRGVRRTDDYDGPRLAKDAEMERRRREGWRTPKELKEERWEQEEEDRTSGVVDKVAARAAYKAMPNSKTKDKKGRVTKDRTGWEEQESGWWDE